MGGCINRASGAAVPAAPLDTRRHVADHPPPLAYTSPNACRALKVSSLVVILSAAAAAPHVGSKWVLRQHQQEEEKKKSGHYAGLVGHFPSTS